jgi:hypothetical protein
MRHAAVLLVLTATATAAEKPAVLAPYTRPTNIAHRGASGMRRNTPSRRMNWR